ncbi:hypothetical protein TNCV_386411 [Trichonephila clavipes]|nr:hypothetical protein TNCV_386411 [Trichonephila clavipes]
MLNLKRGKGIQKSAANPLLKTLLEGRKIRAVHFRSLSSWAEKSVLSSWRVNDLPDLLVSDGLTNTALFADDLAIWCSTPKRDQSKLNTILHLTLKRLHLWCIEKI